MARDISQLHPVLQEKIGQLRRLCEEQNLMLGIGECFRSVQEQNELYAQGRTKPGSIITNAPGDSYSSQHQWGIAFDFYKDVKGHAYDDNGFFLKAAGLAKGIGLAWGGDWSGFVDQPHLYLPYWGSTTAGLKREYGTFPVFKATWAEYGEGDESSGSRSEFQAVGTAICTGDGVRVRSTPSLSGKAIGKLYEGNRFEIDGNITGGWYHIRVVNDSTDYTGWMFGEYVKEDAPVSNWKAVGTAVSTGNDVRVRSTPDAGRSGNILRTLNKGDRFEIDGSTRNGFYHVNVQGTLGWISGLFVKED